MVRGLLETCYTFSSASHCKTNMINVYWNLGTNTYMQSSLVSTSLRHNQAENSSFQMKSLC